MALSNGGPTGVSPCARGRGARAKPAGQGPQVLSSGARTLHPLEVRRRGVSLWALADSSPVHGEQREQADGDLSRPDRISTGVSRNPWALAALLPCELQAAGGS